MIKKTLVIALVGAAVALGGYFVITNINENHGSHESAKTLYTCSMHPQIIRDAPGDCPICGMRLIPVNKKEPKDTGGRKTMYRSSMNPNEVSDKPGKDSMGMEMIPFEMSDKKEEDTVNTPPGLAPVTISGEKRVLIGLEFVAATKRKMNREIRTSVRIVPDETRIFSVTTKIGGWVEKLYVNQTGQFVKKGNPLLSIYSQELMSAQQEYLSTLKARDRFKGDPSSPLVSSMDDLLAAARERLLLLDVPGDQIDRITKTGKVEKAVVLRSPSTGYVTEKMVTPGKKIMMNDTLMTIVDLSRIWGEIDVYESDLPFVKVGMPVEVSLSYWPGKVFKGKVSFLNPFLNPETRTLTARVEIPNPTLTLKPNMNGDAKLSYAVGTKLAVPGNAVMRTGTMDYVFIEGKNDLIVPYLVKIGMQSGDGYYEIISGLKEGERVVSSANFLVDSESSLKAAFKEAAGKHAH